MTEDPNHGPESTPPTVAGCTDPAWQELAPLYALDALEESERRGFEAHARGCAVCRREASAFLDTAAALGDADQQQPPPQLKDDLLAAIRNTPQVAGTDRRPPLPEHRSTPHDSTPQESTPQDSSTHDSTPQDWTLQDSAPQDQPTPNGTVDLPGVAAEEPPAEPVDLAAHRAKASRRPDRNRRFVAVAAAVVVVAVGGAALFRSTTATSDLDDRFAELAAADDASIIQLEGADLDGGGAVTITWSATRDEVAVELADLAPVGADETYALWLLPDGDPVPAALFDNTDDGLALVADLDDLDALGWGVTIEPAGGSEQPTSDILFLGMN